MDGVCGRAGSSRRVGWLIHIGSARISCQDSSSVLFVPAVHAYTPPAVISAPNTSSLRGRLSRVTTSPIRLIPDGPARSLTQRLCSAVVSRWASLPSFPTVGCADDSQVEFRISAYPGGLPVAYFGKLWGNESADKGEHFERGRVQKAWSGVLGISADGLPWADVPLRQFFTPRLLSTPTSDLNILVALFASIPCLQYDVEHDAGESPLGCEPRKTLTLSHILPTFA
ncbi:hypothetical protein ARMSODRAFT_106549 [Armillaria solidipes]|uniref:Uncharacterized protein n=1 Tax=Armillaria solidipes TaxID=1076256 RepID=A0A2H3BKX8_9AGAR|nr:hypothetical protein ARMSODRAFT_106549 [Armillaria solidipes]